MKSKLLISALFYVCLFFVTAMSAQVAPTASFSTASPTICADVPLQITDLSTDFPTSWSYSVNGVGYSTAQNPDITFSVAGTYTIDLESTNATGTSPVYSQTVLVEPKPVVTVSGNTLVCTSAANTLSASGADTYTWSSGSNTNMETIYPAASSIYTLVGTSTLTGCSDSVWVSITAVPLPTITVSDATICAGIPYTLTPSGASTYSFSGGSNTITPLVNTTYTVSGTDALTGCSDSVVVSITVSSVSLAINSGSTCAGQAYTLIPTGATSYTYSGGSNIVTPTVSTTYTVVGELTGGCSDTITVLVSVTPSPTITLNTGTVCLGSTFTIVPGGAISYTYSSGSNTVAPASNTTYVVSGLDPNTGCVGTSTLTLTVSPLPTITVNSGSICAGQTFTLSPSGASSYTIQGGSPTVAPGVSTNYTVIGTSAAGCISAAPATATVIIAGQTPTITITSSNPGALCKGNSIVLTASGASTYSWNSGQTTNSIVISPTVTSIFNVDAYDANGCPGSNSILQSVLECTGVNEHTSNLEFNLYPNPSKGEITIEVAEKMTVVVVNTLGQVVFNQELHAGKNTIEIYNQNSGIYFVTLKQNSDTKTVRIIKD